MLSVSSASQSSSARSPIAGRNAARADSAARCRAVSSSGTIIRGSSSRLRSLIASKMSCWVGSHVRCGLGTPLGVIARLKLPNTSYWVIASPMLGSSCGCVATTW